MDKVIVLGNGPSLKNHNFTSYNLDTIGMNAAYRYWDRVNWYPTHYICMDDKVTDTHHKEIKRLIESNNIKTFFLTETILKYYPELVFKSNIYFIEQFNENKRSTAQKYKLPLIESKYFQSSNSHLITTGSQAIRYAAYLGYKEVTMLGIDLNYKPIPEGVISEQGIGQKINEKIKNNPNYFFDDYQIKGDTFNIPNPPHLKDLHADTFRIIKKDFSLYLWDIKIYNSNKESMLYQEKIFPFCDIDLFVDENKEDTFEKIVDIQKSPRTIIIDPTHIGHNSATGKVKDVFFGNWENDSISQICIDFNGKNLRFSQGLSEIKNNKFTLLNDKEEALLAIKKFKPDLIYFRAIESKELFKLVLKIKEETGTPLVTHIMDDWIVRTRKKNYKEYITYEKLLRRTIANSERLLTICKKMSEVYSFRYGGDWFNLANGVEESDFIKTSESKKEKNGFVIKYMGGAAKDMNYQSILDLSYAVSLINKSDNIYLEINTMPWYLDDLKRKVGSLAGISIKTLVDDSDYHSSLVEADALAIAYNFDSASIEYTSLSFANKLPECLISKRPIIAYGPDNIATIDFIKKLGLGFVVNTRYIDGLIETIRSIKNDKEKTFLITTRALDYAKNNLSKNVARDNIKLHFSHAISASNIENKVETAYDELKYFEKTILKEEISLKFANKLTRDKLYIKALYIYMALYRKKREKSTLFNIKYCLMKLGYQNITPSHLETSF